MYIRKFYIVEKEGYMNLPALKNFIREHPGIEFSKAKIQYDLKLGLPNSKKIDNYPLLLSGTYLKDPFELYIYSVTVGTYEPNSRYLESILNYLKFKFDSNWIFSTQKADYTGFIKFEIEK